MSVYKLPKFPMPFARVKTEHLFFEVCSSRSGARFSFFQVLGQGRGKLQAHASMPFFLETSYMIA